MKNLPEPLPAHNADVVNAVVVIIEDKVEEDNVRGEIPLLFNANFRITSISRDAAEGGNGSRSTRKPLRRTELPALDFKLTTRPALALTNSDKRTGRCGFKFARKVIQPVNNG